MKRSLFFIYSLIAYAIFLATLLYAVGFLANMRVELWHGLVYVPKSMDVGGEATPIGTALVIDAALLSLFAIQHSGMARRGFKRRWTRIVPRPIERSTYVLFSSAALALVFALWRPIGGALWRFDDPVITTALNLVSMLGWSIALVSTFHINHFELFGLRQSLYAVLGREPPAPRFVTPGLYRAVRHPLYLGFVIAFWATPVMTIGHLVFSIATTGYILLAIRLEERDLVSDYGADYERYRRQVPMLAPVRWRSELPRNPEQSR